MLSHNGLHIFLSITVAIIDMKKDETIKRSGFAKNGSIANKITI